MSRALVICGDRARLSACSSSGRMTLVVHAIQTATAKILRAKRPVGDIIINHQACLYAASPQGYCASSGRTHPLYNFSHPVKQLSTGGPSRRAWSCSRRPGYGQRVLIAPREAGSPPALCRRGPDMFPTC